MRHITRGLLATALTLAAAGCANLGYEGPPLYAWQGGHIDEVGQLAQGGIYTGRPCYPRASYLLPGPAGSPGPAGPGGLQGPAGPRGSLGTSPAQWNSMENIQFEYMRAEIQSKCADKIAKLAAWMKDNPTASIALDGHGDDTRANDFDPSLSARRVQAVRAALVAAGVAPSRISDGAFGARRSLCAEATVDCLALNRRVEVLSAELVRQQ